MLARAAVSIGLEVNRPPSPEPSQLDDWFLGAGHGSQPRSTPVPFFPEVHEELTKSWVAPFTARSRSSASSILTTLDGGVAKGYAGIPQVERAIVVHLCPRNAATWRNCPRLPSKACKLTAALAAKADSAAGQAASALHAMAIQQVHQAKVLKQVHEGSTDPGLMQELRTATDFALRATKVTARSLGKAMSTMVVQERHLWLKLAEIKVEFGEAQVDLFASPESSHCQLYFSLTEGPLGTDALAHNWPRAFHKYAFPPVSLLAQTLCKLREDEEHVPLVAPHWPTRTWFPELISLATAPPWRIPLRKDLLSQGLGTIWHPRPDLWNLHVWLLDGTRQT